MVHRIHRLAFGTPLVSTRPVLRMTESGVALQQDCLVYGQAERATKNSYACYTGHLLITSNDQGGDAVVHRQHLPLLRQF